MLLNRIAERFASPDPRPSAVTKHGPGGKAFEKDLQDGATGSAAEDQGADQVDAEMLADQRLRGGHEGQRASNAEADAELAAKREASVKLHGLFRILPRAPNPDGKGLKLDVLA